MDLLERDTELRHVERSIAAACGGTGSAVAVCGEAGAGKSALVAAACSEFIGVRVLRGRCDPLVTPRPLGPVRDVVADLGGTLPAATTPAEVCEVAYDRLRSEPTVVVVEDLHWVDEASVEVLRFLLRRIESIPCALLLTYRDDAVAEQHPVRALLGDLAVLDGASTVRLRPLTLDGVATLLDGSPLDAAAVHTLTGGNPFFTSEVAKDPGLPLPATVRDAVLARTVDIAPADFEVLQLAASAPDRLDDRVLPALDVDLPTLRRLHRTGLLLRERGGLVFRHELARLAVESTIPTGGTARLHARLLDALEDVAPQDHAVLTHHALAAGDAVRAAEHARAAAEDAARSGSHTEAASLYETALANLPGVEPQERARLLIRLATEQYMTGRLEPAIATVSATFPLWRGSRDDTGLSTAHQSCAVFEYYNAHRKEAEAHAERAATLAPRSAREFGVARATRGYLAYHRGDVGLLHECLEDAVRVAEEVDDHFLAVHSRLVAGINALALGRDGARDALVAVIEEARENGYDEMASTGYSNLADLDVEHRRLAEAERVLEESLAFTVERDIPICNHWQTGVRSRLRLLEGRTRAALEDAEEALDRTGMPLATFWPHLVVGLAHLRRDGSDDGHLMAAWRLAERLDEQSRLLPALAALAERMWLTGVPDPIVTGRAATELELAAASPARSWSAGELAVWLTRLGIRPAIDPGAVSEPHRLVLTGQPDRAATWWHRAGCVVDEALSGLDAADPDVRSRAVERLDGLGGVATADRLRRTLRQEGVARVPARPRASTQGNPSGLTNRQLDVARLVARGFTNAQIAERLFISPKTADHHVSAVLMKLGIANRRAVVVQAQELGLS